MKSADEWIRILKLEPHVEGGYFREVYRSPGLVAPEALAGRHAGPRCFGTSIYFLLKSGQASRFHRLASDEIWHFYAGSPVTLHLLVPEEGYRSQGLGADPGRGQSFQAVMPAHTWFGATVDEPESYALVGCTVAPGFDFADFEIGRREELSAAFPQQTALIRRLT